MLTLREPQVDALIPVLKEHLQQNREIIDREFISDILEELESHAEER